MENKTEKIQRLTQIYAVIAIVIISIIVTLVSVTPLYLKLREIEKRDLIFARDTSSLLINGYFSRLKDIARQVSSRTKAKQLLEDYENRKISYDEMNQFLSTILNAALKSNVEMVGIARVNLNGEIMSEVGLKPKAQYFLKGDDRLPLKLYSPYYEDNHHYLTVLSPVLDTSNQEIGYDIILFDVTNFHGVIQNKLQHRLGEIIIAYLDDGKVNLFEDIKKLKDSGKIVQINDKLSSLLLNVISHRAEGVTELKINNKPNYIAYAPLGVNNWGIAVIIKKSDLFGSIQVILLMILATVFVVIILFIIGIVLCLKPLSGKIILYSKELQDRIKQAQEELKDANEKLSYLAIHDPLTRVMNRRGIEEVLVKELSKVKRYQFQLTVLFVDLDKFKRINDELGHHIGDDVLIEVSKRLQKALREGDIVGRLGGDEFIIVAPYLKLEDAHIIVTRIRELLKEPIMAKEHKLFIEVSIGVSNAPKHGDTPDNLLKLADKLMYEEKVSKDQKH